MGHHAFPEDFVWGAATSSQQIEGGRHEGGRGESIWDRFASRPGAIEDGSTPDVTCDHYHRWREDIGLMRWLGLGAYRFSIAWPRILPDGRGRVSDEGLDFYDSLVDGLLEADIEPFPTLYHWDLPQALQDRGGWSERDTAHAFVEYTETVARRLGDRIGRWVTHNEPWCAAILGHEEGHHAPGHHDPAEAMRAAHHLLLSHGWATAALRREAPGAEVGIVHIHTPVHPATDSPDDRDAARWLDAFFNRWYLDPVFRGSYPGDGVDDRVALGHLKSAELPFLEDGDLAAISAPIDFLGLNYYSRAVMKAGPGGRPVDAKTVPRDELTEMGWEVYPDGLRESLVRVHRDYAPRAIYVTENGAAFDDPPATGDRIADRRRVEYFRTHLLAAREAIAEGVPLKGYFAWSLMDNFEWGHGFLKRFGLFAVDYETLERRPKDSAYWYRDVVAASGVVDVPTTADPRESRAIDPQ